MVFCLNKHLRLLETPKGNSKTQPYATLTSPRFLPLFRQVTHGGGPAKTELWPCLKLRFCVGLRSEGGVSGLGASPQTALTWRSHASAAADAPSQEACRPRAPALTLESVHIQTDAQGVSSPSLGAPLVSWSQAWGDGAPPIQGSAYLLPGLKGHLLEARGGRSLEDFLGLLQTGSVLGGVEGLGSHRLQQLCLRLRRRGSPGRSQHAGSQEGPFTEAPGQHTGHAANVPGEARGHRVL